MGGPSLVSRLVDAFLAIASRREVREYAADRKSLDELVRRI